VLRRGSEHHLQWPLLPILHRPDPVVVHGWRSHQPWRLNQVWESRAERVSALACAWVFWMASFHFRSWFLGAVGANGTERTNTLHRKGYRSVLGFRFGFATIMLLASYNLNTFCKKLCTSALL
jgi:hypothetical protein